MITESQKARLREASDQLEALSDELDEESISNLYVATKEASDGAFILTANAEGFAYLASILASLAADGVVGKHYHFDKTTVLAECERSLIIRFSPAPWEPPDSTP